MKVSMAEINKKANQIINQVAESGETVVILKHGQAIAEIRPVAAHSNRAAALSYLRKLQPIKVKEPVENVVAKGRQRGV